MNIAACAAFAPGYELVRFVIDSPYPPVLVATCDRDTSEYEEKIAAVCALRGVRCMRRVDASSPAFIAELHASNIDLVTLLWWPAIIKSDAISAVGTGWVNLHPSLLPYNRGKHPYYWAIVDGTPYGATMHFIDPRVDAGRILFQRSIPVHITDTGETLYQRSVEASIALFKDSYAALARGEFSPTPVVTEQGTFHHARDIDPHSRIILDQEYRAGDLINRIRARTFWHGDSASFEHEGKTYLVRISIEEKGNV